MCRFDEMLMSTTMECEDVKKKGDNIYSQSPDLSSIG
jgi:hypothetical protein